MQTVNESLIKPRWIRIGVLALAGVYCCYWSLGHAGTRSSSVHEHAPLEDGDCVGAPESFAALFAVSSGGVCVAGLLGHIQGSSPPTHLGSLPRRVSFAVGEASLEKALIYGRQSMRAFIASLGFGHVPAGVYHLVVWRRTVTPELTRCHWRRLEAMLRGTYGALPAGTGEAIREMEGKRFSNLTGCDPVALARAPIDFRAAGCSHEFAEAAVGFADGLEACDIEKGLCAGEQRLLAQRTPLTAACLRAFLYSVLDFNPFFTGHSYTAERDRAPREREFWFVNRPLSKLVAGDYAVIRLDVG